VRAITHVLATVRSPVSHQPYLPEAFPHYGPQVIAAVKRFQTEHHHTADGIVGPHTATQLAVAMRAHEQNPGTA
jgi:murein L,D-transpeptidase YcbB/YkuD